MATKASVRRQKRIRDLWRGLAFGIFAFTAALFLGIMSFIAVTPPENWEETDIVVSSFSYRRQMKSYRLIDEEGVTYHIGRSRLETEEIVCGKQYHIAYEPGVVKQIYFMTDGENIYVSYNEVVEERNRNIVLGWVFVGIGVAGNAPLIVYGICKTRMLRKKTLR